MDGWFRWSFRFGWRLGLFSGAFWGSFQGVTNIFGWPCLRNCMVVFQQVPKTRSGTLWRLEKRVWLTVWPKKTLQEVGQKPLWVWTFLFNIYMLIAYFWMIHGTVREQRFQQFEGKVLIRGARCWFPGYFESLFFFVLVAQMFQKKH